jgi:copper chaperone CopZ
MSSKIYTIPNISCGHCVATIEREVGGVAGVQDVTGNVDSKEVTVVYDDEAALVRVEKLLEEIRYPATG